ncbi:MAG: cyclic nucleotide-binding/CBS domain-containing protein [Candidatus Bathyarchaeia archaeon]
MILKVEDVMVEDVITVDSDAPVMEAVGLMNKHEIGCLIVTRKGKAVGIVTERDLLKRVLAESRDPKKTRVRQIMSKPLIFGEPDMDIEDAARFMFRKNIKKLPVVENGRLLGLVTLTDLARFQPQIMKLLKKITKRELPPRRMKKVFDYYVV